MADFWISLGHGSVCYMLLCIYQWDLPLRGHWRAILPRPTAQTAIKKKKKKKTYDSCKVAWIWSTFSPSIEVIQD